MYKINISPQARDDILGVKNYVSCELSNDAAALSLVSKILDKISTLAEFPLIGRMLSGLLDVDTKYRFVVCENYLIFYRVHEKEIFVARVLYAKRDYAKILLNDSPVLPHKKITLKKGTSHQNKITPK